VLITFSVDSSVRQSQPCRENFEDVLNSLTCNMES